MIWVIDASVAVRWLIEEETHPHAEEVLRLLIHHPAYFAVPELFAFEVFSVLQRIHPEGLRAYRHGIIPLLHGGMLRQPMTESLAVEADRFVKLGLTGYDANYAALAKELQGRWLTFDRNAHRRIEKARVSAFLGAGGMPKDWPGR